jgi:hypothetical protein
MKSIYDPPQSPIIKQESHLFSTLDSHIQSLTPLVDFKIQDPVDVFIHYESLFFHQLLAEPLHHSIYVLSSGFAGAYLSRRAHLPIRMITPVLTLSLGLSYFYPKTCLNIYQAFTK